MSSTSSAKYVLGSTGSKLPAIKSSLAVTGSAATSSLKHAGRAGMRMRENEHTTPSRYHSQIWCSSNQAKTVFCRFGLLLYGRDGAGLALARAIVPQPRLQHRDALHEPRGRRAVGRGRQRGRREPAVAPGGARNTRTAPRLAGGQNLWAQHDLRAPYSRREQARIGNLICT